MVRLDRGAQEILVPFERERWRPAPAVKLTAMQVARVAYHADQGLRLVSGEYNVPDWPSLKDRARMDWLKGPPGGASPERVAFYRHVLEFFR